MAETIKSLKAKVTQLEAENAELKSRLGDEEIEVDRLLSPTKMAAMTGTSPHFWTSKYAVGNIPMVRLGGVLRILESDFKRLLKAQYIDLLPESDQQTSNEPEVLYDKKTQKTTIDGQTVNSS